MEQIKLGEFEIDVEIKDIKNIHLGVYPPNGRVRIAVPTSMDLEQVRIYLISKLDWIRTEQKSFLSQTRETPREYITQESHYLFGKRYLLKVIQVDDAPKVIEKHSTIELYVRPGSDINKKKIIMDDWYREQLKEIVPEYVAKWESILDLTVNEVAIKKMKTKWGSCSVDARRIWLNLELAKKPIESIEYVIVHEMLHFLERTHSRKFIARLEKYLPQWSELRSSLNESPLGHAEWS